MIKVSIIIPVYNVAPYIATCLNSVLNQTYSNIECIIVNDCGQDESMQIINSILEHNSSMCIVKIVNHEVNKGLSEARNTGIQSCSGDYLYFLDSDDYISEDAIECMISLVINHPVDFVIGDLTTVGETKNCKFLHITQPYIFENKNIARLYSESKWYMMAWNKLISRQFILDNEMFFYPGIYHEDELWSFKLALFARSMAVCKQTTYFYRIRTSGSIMSKLTRKHIDDMLFIFETCLLSLENQDQKALYSKIRTFYLSIICNLNRLQCDVYTNRILQRIEKNKHNLRFNINFISCSLKNKLKFALCLIPVKVLYHTANKLPF